MDAQKELIAEFDREAAKTRKMLEALPEGVDFTYKPHPKSMSLGHLAGHLTDFAGDWAMGTLTKDKVEFPAGIRSGNRMFQQARLRCWRSLKRRWWGHVRRW